MSCATTCCPESVGTIVSVEDQAWGLIGAGAGISLKNSKGHLSLQEYWLQGRLKLGDRDADHWNLKASQMSDPK